jgi:hypothetical protein
VWLCHCVYQTLDHEQCENMRSNWDSRDVFPGAGASSTWCKCKATRNGAESASYLNVYVSMYPMWKRERVKKIEPASCSSLISHAAQYTKSQASSLATSYSTSVFYRTQVRCAPRSFTAREASTVARESSMAMR